MGICANRFLITKGAFWNHFTATDSIYVSKWCVHLNSWNITRPLYYNIWNVMYSSCLPSTKNVWIYFQDITIYYEFTYLIIYFPFSTPSIYYFYCYTFLDWNIQGRRFIVTREIWLALMLLDWATYLANVGYKTQQKNNSIGRLVKHTSTNHHQLHFPDDWPLLMCK